MKTIVAAFLCLTACDPPPQNPQVAATTYAALDAYACALAFQSPQNALNYSAEVALCKQQCLQQFGLACVSCEGQVQNEGWSYCRAPMDSPSGTFYVRQWLSRLADHLEIMSTQQVGIDPTIGIGFTYANQIASIGDCDNTRETDLLNGVAGCAAKWTFMVCDTVQGDQVCPQALPPIAYIRGGVDVEAKRWSKTAPWDLAAGGREGFRKRVLERAVKFEKAHP